MVMKSYTMHHKVLDNLYQNQMLNQHMYNLCFEGKWCETLVIIFAPSRTQNLISQH